MTTERLNRLKHLTEHARDVLGETHMELTTGLVLELIADVQGVSPCDCYWCRSEMATEKQLGKLETIEEFTF